MNEQHDAALSQAVRLREEGTQQACEQLLSLADRYLQDAAIACQTAWACDALGLEAKAVPFYERA
jgi:hypothetical protein